MNAPLLTARIVLALAIALVAPALRLQAGDSDVLRVELYKHQDFDQISAAGPTAGGYSWEFDLEVFDASAVAQLITGGNVTPPGGSPFALIHDLPGDTFIHDESGASFNTEAALDAAFPNGTYAFALQTVNAPISYAFSLALVGAFHPNAPTLTNSEWVNEALQFDSTQNYELTWSAFTATGGVSSRILLYISSEADETVVSAVLAPTATSFLLSPGMLDPNQSYEVILKFQNFSSATSDGGTELNAWYEKRTYASIRTVTTWSQWRQFYFGSPDNAGPGADTQDPDGDGFNNRFEFLAGLVPTNPKSRFRTRVDLVPNQSGKMNIIFSPCWSGRVYTVLSRPDLLPGPWTPLSSTSETTNDAERTVTDLDASGTKFYRVEVTQ